MLDLHFPASFKPMLLPSPTVIVSTKWQPMANISEASFLSSLPGEEKALKTLGINFKTSCLTLQSKEMLEMQVKWHKPFEYKLSHSTEWLSFVYHSTDNLLKTSAFPETFFFLCTSTINSITRNKSENADGSSNSCLCGAWACHNSGRNDMPDTVLCRLWVVSASFHWWCSQEQDNAGGW